MPQPNHKHKILYTEKRIEQRVKTLAQKINHDYQNKKPIVIALLKGCIPFYTSLFLKLTCNPIMDFMVVSSYHGTKQQKTIKIVTDLRTNIRGRDIIIVDDIVDTGRTLTKLVKILKARGCKSLKVACLLLRSNNKGLIKPDYICFTTDHTKDEFIIGYGLDYLELYRNLPYIALMNSKALKKSVK
jgi:hypoxanthine phosphoribosyltransferase